MREIKFRAWGTAVEPAMYYMDTKSAMGKLSDLQENETWKVMQFTGLLDKNGKEVFEGDIVKWDDNSDGEYWRVAIVRINPDLGFECFDCPAIENSSAHGRTFKFGSFIYTDTHNHLEIIGNIYENPELTTGDL